MLYILNIKHQSTNKADNTNFKVQHRQLLWIFMFFSALNRRKNVEILNKIAYQDEGGEFCLRVCF